MPGRLQRVVGIGSDRVRIEFARTEPHLDPARAVGCDLRPEDDRSRDIHRIDMAAPDDPIVGCQSEAPECWNRGTSVRNL